ncbi:DUF3040 domain-containing protein [Streptomyces indicus]|uniref:DUF3040 domain-containing protein n=1 Tax=Streptomyces indicus TaxID=417292 RepID=A0A1G8T6U9_9ACTN|nr:DUF3040 domain-containing protein [Streptomyces indicus]SDJ37213.1 Protein of unknown function [Streptomyces indicus]
MSPADERHLRALEAQLELDDPQFARALARGRPRRPRECRRRWAWLVAGAAAGCFAYGVAVGQGLLIATGLVIAGAATHLFDPPQLRSARAREPRHGDR